MKFSDTQALLFSLAFSLPLFSKDFVKSLHLWSISCYHFDLLFPFLSTFPSPTDPAPDYVPLGYIIGTRYAAKMHILSLRTPSPTALFREIVSFSQLLENSVPADVVGVLFAFHWHLKTLKSFFNWRIIALQCCVVCCTTWISYMYT